MQDWKSMRSVFRGALNGLHALYNVLSCTLLPKKSIEINVLYNQRIGKSLFIQIYFKCCIKNTVRFIELQIVNKSLHDLSLANLIGIFSHWV